MRSLEQLMAETPSPVLAAERAFSRIQGLQEFVFRVDVGDYPIQWFSSGETKKVKKNVEGKCCLVDEPVGLPIHPKGKEKGLRDLACRIIFDEREHLGTIDKRLEDQADRIITTGQVRDPGSFIGNRGGRGTH
jgi:hypothetical protein